MTNTGNPETVPSATADANSSEWARLDVALRGLNNGQIRGLAECCERLIPLLAAGEADHGAAADAGKPAPVSDHENDRLHGFARCGDQVWIDFQRRVEAARAAQAGYIQSLPTDEAAVSSALWEALSEATDDDGLPAASGILRVVGLSICQLDQQDSDPRLMAIGQQIARAEEIIGAETRRLERAFQIVNAARKRRKDGDLR